MHITASFVSMIASLLMVGTAHAIVSIEITGPTTPGVGNVYEITLITGPEGISSFQFDLVTATGSGQSGLVFPPMIPRSDPTCGAPVSETCDMSGSNPVINVGTNPNGLSGFGLFTLNTPPTGPSTYTYIAEATFDFYSLDEISFANLLGFDALGNPLSIAAPPVLTIAPLAPPWNYRANFTHHVVSGGSFSRIIEDRHVDLSMARFVTPNHNPGGGPGVATTDSLLLTHYGDFWDLDAFGPGATAGTLTAGASFNVLAVDRASVVNHVTTTLDTIDNYTFIDHPALNGQPDLRLLLQGWDITSSGLVGDYPSVYYLAGSEKWGIFLQDPFENMPLGAAFHLLVLPDDGTSFVHTAATASVATVLDHPRLNGNPDALIQVTQNWNPAPSTGVYNNHQIAVAYDDGLGRWTIQNEDGVPMNVGAAFNVYVPLAPSFVWQHRSNQGNVIGHITDTAHPSANGNNTAILLETQNLAPLSGSAVAHPHATGIYYSAAPGWSIFSEDGSTAYPVDAASNVFQPPIDFRTYVHVAQSGNVAGNTTNLGHPLVQGDHDALVFATRRWSKDDESTGVYSDHNFGLYYTGTTWSVFNEDGAAHGIDVAYDIHVAGPGSDAFTHLASPSNVSGDRTTIDDASTNDLPDLGLIITHNWNPPGGSSTYNDHPIGVDYDAGAGRWQIVNLDGAAMPTTAAFNVLVVPEPDQAVSLGAGVVLLFLMSQWSARRDA